MANQIVKPSTLPGFIEWLPADQIAFNKMMDTIRKNYEKYGFIPVDTPVIEKSEVLLAKGGGETEKQIYRFTKGDSDLSLRFDLTVPLARFVAQHMNELNFPFRRYQIGKVYRGERNQKGRFREFYQCDIDIIGNGKLSIINDAEIPSIIYSTFTDLGFDSFTIHINNRKVLNGFFDAAGVENKMETLRIIDKLDKIGIEAVKNELKELGLSDGAIERIEQFINISGSSDEVLEGLKNLNIQNEEFVLGLQELSKVVYYIRQFGVPDKNFMIDLKIARGLDYYTGTVYETILNDYPGIGSVCSGGRYDNLAEYYTAQKLPGVGISIGLSRLFYQLKEAGFFKESTSSTLTKVLVVPMDENVSYSIKVSNELKKAGIITEVYFEEGKFAKKLNYANKLGIPYVIIIGEDEIASNVLTLKNMSTGEQLKLTVEEIINKIG
ncbi:histidine--tRNA ligase [Clostridium sp. SYSU_GA19001]|uniref:histidine--tRNA ligase n=1 Tax=Clostridium caldaquaticum TaxID=2940653 RepID=UPI00207717F2|nr:histidine--tRNA ligase [Clostridium caldaquaticum]MCM8709623.1 histidine--tRNA ligase [Clostridium caldaquaticum]